MEALKNLYNRHIVFFNFLLLVASLYLFLFSLGLMGASLKMFGKGMAETLISTTTNPLVGLFIGILAMFTRPDICIKVRRYNDI